MPKDIGKTLKECRIASKMSVKEISDLLTCKGFKASESTIYSWENGNSQPTPGALLTMCTAYGIDNVLETFGYNGYNEDGSIQLNLHEIEHIEKYRNLDDLGRNHVDTVLQWETDRMEQLSQTESQISELKSRPVALVDFYTLKPDSTRITEYFRSASAGDGIFILGNEVKARAIIPESSWIENTDYVIGVSGDSMKPDFEDGDNVMVSQHVPLHHGDVGIFVVNGNVYIKEYGETELISRNPDFPNIKISEYDNIVCMGKVLGKLKGDYKIVNE